MACRSGLAPELARLRGRCSGSTARSGWSGWRPSAIRRRTGTPRRLPGDGLHLGQPAFLAVPETTMEPRGLYDGDLRDPGYVMNVTPNWARRPCVKQSPSDDPGAPVVDR